MFPMNIPSLMENVVIQNKTKLKKMSSYFLYSRVEGIGFRF